MNICKNCGTHFEGDFCPNCRSKNYITRNDSSHSTKPPQLQGLPTLSPPDPPKNTTPKREWYLSIWFIAALFALWPLYGIPLIAGVILIIIRSKREREYFKAYDNLESINDAIDRQQQEYKRKSSALEDEYVKKNSLLETDYIKHKEKSDAEIKELLSSINELSSQYDLLNKKLLLEHFSFSSYDGLTSEECKNKLSLLRQSEKELLSSGKALTITSTEAKKVVNDNSKQIIRCFNCECDNILVNLSNKNIDAMRAKLTKSYESLNKIFAVDGVALSKKLLEMKLKELSLVYSYEIKREQEAEQRKAIREQMLEEAKVEREIERKKAQIEKDQKQFNNELNKLMKYLQKSTNDIEKQLYVEKITELEAKLKALEKDKDDVLQREANAKAGFVYVISNIGSFGENVYKIGMTRRLEPMDRIKELSSASVPFEFDVHAMIFSDNAPKLEDDLHKYFENKSVNRVNLRKEFFRVSLDEIENVVKNKFDGTATFTKIPTATEYRQTLAILSSESNS